VVLHHIAHGSALALGYKPAAQVVGGGILVTGLLEVFVNINAGHAAFGLLHPAAVTIINKVGCHSIFGNRGQAVLYIPGASSSYLHIAVRVIGIVGGWICDRGHGMRFGGTIGIVPGGPAGCFGSNIADSIVAEAFAISPVYALCQPVQVVIDEVFRLWSTGLELPLDQVAGGIEKNYLVFKVPKKRPPD
jgi:hypothetical protein